MNPAIVQVPEDGQQSHRYRFTDHHVEAGQTYYYYLDFIARNGSKHAFSGVLAKTLPPVGAEGE